MVYSGGLQIHSTVNPDVQDRIDFVRFHGDLQVEVPVCDDALECASCLKSYAWKYEVIFLQVCQSYEFLSGKRMILTHYDAEFVVEKYV